MDLPLREEKIGVWDEWMPTAALKDLLIYTETLQHTQPLVLPQRFKAPKDPKQAKMLRQHNFRGAKLITLP